MRNRGHIEDLRDRVGGDTVGFQIHGTPGGEAPAPAPEQIPLCDAPAEFLRGVTALEIARLPKRAARRRGLAASILLRACGASENKRGRREGQDEKERGTWRRGQAGA